MGGVSGEKVTRPVCVLSATLPSHSPHILQGWESWGNREHSTSTAPSLAPAPVHMGRKWVCTGSSRVVLTSPC